MEKTEFLMLSYKEADFLINKPQVVSSFYLEANLPVQQFDGINFISFQDGNLPYLDLDNYIITTFNFKTDFKANLILVSDKQQYSGSGKRKLENYFRNVSEISDRFIALKSIGNAKIVSINLGELKLVPMCIRELLNDNGIFGVRFTEENRGQFFIDVEHIISNLIEKNKQVKEQTK